MWEAGPLPAAGHAGLPRGVLPSEDPEVTLLLAPPTRNCPPTHTPQPRGPKPQSCSHVCSFTSYSSALKLRGAGEEATSSEPRIKSRGSARSTDPSWTP